jgi:hypothetical protein
LNGGIQQALAQNVLPDHTGFVKEDDIHVIIL